MKRAKSLLLAQLSKIENINYRVLMFYYSLQLEIYRSLGVEWLSTSSENSKKCRVRSAINNDVHSLEITPEHNIFEITNRLWDFCSF